ncbi:hypothetical protein QE391_004597 [Pseudomonas fluorescens]|nr:hypothetical protein [Pseudomonas fluorescens]
MTTGIFQPIVRDNEQFKKCHHNDGISLIETSFCNKYALALQRR